MNLNEQQVKILRAALIAGRRYCFEVASEWGANPIEMPDDEIKAAMEMMGMKWDNKNEVA